jgi:peptidoglycan/LPS O-acetylase OafA/YrhL
MAMLDRVVRKSKRAIKPMLAMSQTSSARSLQAASEAELTKVKVAIPLRIEFEGRHGASGGMRLPSVDGLRAFAALWVLIFHIKQSTSFQLSEIPVIDLLLSDGYAGVSLFLVLSGFCLYLPFAHDRVGRFRASSFFVRRCYRVLPAYYLALAIAVAIKIVVYTWLGTGVLTPSELGWHIFTHITFSYTFFPETFYSLSGAFWSLGLEWHLYAAFPFILWGARNIGFNKTVVAVLCCHLVYVVTVKVGMMIGIVERESLLAYVVLPNQFLGRWPEFVLGMSVAELYKRRLLDTISVPAYLLTLGLVPVSLSGIEWPLRQWLSGCGFAALLILALRTGSPVARLFSWRPLVGAGVISYSIYLLHAPIVGTVDGFALRSLHASPSQAFLITLCTVPLIMFGSWLFFLVAERPFLVNRATRSALPSGAPILVARTSDRSA